MTDELDDTEDLAARRPRTRGDCVTGPRPCPWYACRHHAGLDVLPNGRVTIRIAPHLLGEDGRPSCTLDVAALGAQPPITVAHILSARVVEVQHEERRALAKFRVALQREHGARARDLLDDPVAA